MILGPGTGLGIGALVEAAGRHTPLASEACHIDFGPVGDEESALWPHLERVYGRVTTESVLAGPGLARVHAARVAVLGGPKPTLDTPAVVAAALADRSGVEAASLRLYWRIVARFAGDMGVAFVATGGVTLAGGVLPRIVDFLDDSAFRARLRGQGAGRRAWRAAFRPVSSFAPTPCWSAWPRSPPRRSATRSTTPRGPGHEPPFAPISPLSCSQSRHVASCGKLGGGKQAGSEFDDYAFHRDGVVGAGARRHGLGGPGARAKLRRRLAEDRAAPRSRIGYDQRR